MRNFKLNFSKHIFYLPALLLFAFYIIIPVIVQIYFSFIKWQGIAPVMNSFTIAHYIEVFKEIFVEKGGLFLNAFKNNIKYALMVGFVQNNIAFLLAFLFSYKIKGNLFITRRKNTFFRTTFFIPSLISLAVLGFIWTYILNYYGVLNYVLQLTGLKFLIVDWLGNQNYALFSIAMVQSWQYFGMVTLLFYAGFLSIPDELLEAAEIDGANIFQKIRRISLPLLAPSITIISVLTIIGSFKTFELPYIMTRGGPGHASDVVMTLIVREGIKNYRYGYGNAASTILFIFLLIITIVMLKFFIAREEKIE
jgi:raffinose/stachyose/melibiose transport system permease protein